MRLRDEASSNGSCYRASESTSGKNADSIRPGDGIPQVCESSTHDCQGCRGEETTEKAAYAYSRDILGKSDWNLEDSEECKTEHEWSLPT